MNTSNEEIHYPSQRFTDHNSYPTYLCRSLSQIKRRRRIIGFCYVCNMLRPCYCFPYAQPRSPSKPKEPCSSFNLKSYFNACNKSSPKHKSSYCDSSTYCKCDSESDNLVLECKRSCPMSSNGHEASRSCEQNTDSVLDEGTKDFSCQTCNLCLSPTFCKCGRSTYCDRCNEITPCDRCPSTEDITGLSKCSQCLCTLINPYCPCGRGMYCVICEELNPCNCELYRKQPKCTKCRNILISSASATCKHPIYCWQCEEHCTCCLCSKETSTSSDRKSQDYGQYTFHLHNDKYIIEDENQDHNKNETHREDKHESNSSNRPVSCKSNITHLSRKHNGKISKRKKRYYTIKCCSSNHHRNPGLKTIIIEEVQLSRSRNRANSRCSAH